MAGIGSFFGGDKRVVIDVNCVVGQINEKFEVEPVASYVPTANYRLVVKVDGGEPVELSLKPNKTRPSHFLYGQHKNAKAIEAIVAQDYPDGLDALAIEGILAGSGPWGKLVEQAIKPIGMDRVQQAMQQTKDVLDEYSVQGVSHSRETPKFIETDTVTCWLPVELKTGYLLQYDGRKPEQVVLSDGNNEAKLNRVYHNQMAIPEDSHGVLVMIDPDTKDVEVMDLSAGNQYFDMDELNGFTFNKDGDVTKKFVPHSERKTVLGALGSMTKNLFGSRDNG